MAAQNLGCFARSVRFLLVILNFVFLLLGIVVFITAAVLKWSTLFNKFINIDGIDSLIKVGSISTVSTILLVISGFAVGLSLFGICGAKYMNRFFLIIYEVLIVILFLVHGVSILVLVFSSSKIENEFRKGINSTIHDLNSNDTKPSDFKAKCDLSFAISEIFHCCGAQEPNDFVNASLVEKCCKRKDYKVACGDKVVSSIKNNAVNLLIIPNSVILAIELFGIIMVPFLIGRAGKNSDDDFPRSFSNISYK